MAFQTDRRATLPPDWERRRQAVLQRDGFACVWCSMPGREVDHIGDRHDHSLGNLRTLCTWCHGRRTAAQGNAARRRVRQRRDPESHPGLRN